MKTGEYTRLKDASNLRRKAASRDERDIGRPARVKNRKDRTRTDASLKAFLDRFFEMAFSLPWSPDHLRVIDRLHLVVTNGGLYALAMPRSSGKTTICERAALWAVLSGRRKFVLIIAATEELGVLILNRLKRELEKNALLYA